jgi:Flp pilus assembly pilin Flp
MTELKAAARRLLREERGSEISEYAIVLGLIAVACITVVSAFGVKVMARWNSVNSGM